MAAASSLYALLLSDAENATQTSSSDATASHRRASSASIIAS
jgi:hypothetical protein